MMTKCSAFKVSRKCPLVILVCQAGERHRVKRWEVKAKRWEIDCYGQNKEIELCLRELSEF
jgi:hypothetical protein